MAVAVVDVQVNSQGAVRNLNQVNAASKAATVGVNGLRSALAPLLVAFEAIKAVKFVFAKTAELETQTRSIQTLTGSVTKAKQIIQELQQIGAVTPFTSTELIDTAKRLSAFGISADRVVDTTRRLGDVAGATGANLGELSLAYGQVIAKGRLQGEELLQFQERGVALQDELRKMYGLTGEEFSKALSKGQISAQAVEVALQRLTNTGGKYANGAIAQSDTLSGRLSTLQDGVEALARRIGQTLTPALKAIFNQAIQVVDSINQALAAGGIATGQKQAFQREAQAAVRAQAGFLPGGPFGAGEININYGGKSYKGSASGVVSQITNDLINNEVKRQLGQTRAAQRTGLPTAIPALGGGTAAAGGGGRAGGSGKAAAQAKQIKDITGQELELRLRLGMAQQSENDKQQAFYTKQLALLQIAQQEIGPNERKAQIMEAVVRYATTMKDINEKEAKETLPSIVDRIADMAAGYSKSLDFTVQLTEQQKQQKELADGIANTVGQGMAGAFNALIQGSEDFGTSLRRIASGVLIDIANQLLQVFVIQKAINAISGFLGGGGGGGGGLSYAGVSGNALGISVISGGFNAVPFAPTGLGFGSGFGIMGERAMGGSVTAGQPYLVGERGPELFMPGRSGGIAPAGSFGSGMNVIVNVDAKGTGVQGDQQQGAALGRAISAAVQAELVKQQRPGGLLAGAR